MVVGLVPEFPGPNIVGLWHVAQPIPPLASSAKIAAPDELRHMSVGTGGSMLLRNATIDVSGTASASGGTVGRVDAPQPLTRSVGASGLVRPISSRNASPINSTSVAV